MSLYVDSSALLKRYIDEPDSAPCEKYLRSTKRWITARHTYVEVRRNLNRLLAENELVSAREFFLSDWERFYVIELDETTCVLAADIADATQLKTLDALHLAALSRVGRRQIPLLTYDIRQAQAARSLGIQVVGV